MDNHRFEEKNYYKKGWWYILKHSMNKINWYRKLFHKISKPKKLFWRESNLGLLILKKTQIMLLLYDYMLKKSWNFEEIVNMANFA